MFQSYRNQSVDLEAKQFTGVYMMGTLVVKRLNLRAYNFTIFCLSLFICLKNGSLDFSNIMEPNFLEKSLFPQYLEKKRARIAQNEVFDVSSKKYRPVC